LEKSYFMVKFGFILFLTINTLYPNGLKRKINFGIHRTVVVVIFGADDVEATEFGLGMILPLSSNIGMNMGLSGLSLGGQDVYQPIVTGEVGLWEALPMKCISPHVTPYAS